jgi:hypothetical protein
MEMDRNRSSMRRAALYVLAVMIIVPARAMPVQAGVVDKAISSWEPGVIRGHVMQRDRGLIVVAEKRIMVVDTVYMGKAISTRIQDAQGREASLNGIRAGKYILAKGGFARDDERKTDVLVATDVYILDRPFGQLDEQTRKKLMEPAQPW